MNLITEKGGYLKYKKKMAEKTVENLVNGLEFLERSNKRSSFN